MLRKQSIGPWKSDAEVARCENCQEPFSLFRRRHHCRCCGCIFCDACCNARLPVPHLANDKPQRVCFHCCAMILSLRGGDTSRRGCPAATPPPCGAMSTQPHTSGVPPAPPPPSMRQHSMPLPSAPHGVAGTDTPTPLHTPSAAAPMTLLQARNTKVSASPLTVAHQSDVAVDGKDTTEEDDDEEEEEKATDEEESVLRARASVLAEYLQQQQLQARSKSCDAGELVYHHPPFGPDAESEEGSGDDVETAGLSSAMVGILSSREDIHTSSLAFLFALQSQLLESDASNVLRVLLVASVKMYSVTLVTVGAEETMGQLAARLAESFFKLMNGPCKSFRDEQRAELLPRLHFFTSQQQIIAAEERAVLVAMAHRHVVLSTMTASEVQAFRAQCPDGITSSMSALFVQPTSPKEAAPTATTCVMGDEAAMAGKKENVGEAVETAGTVAVMEK